MNSRDFAYWLQGFFEIAEEGLNKPQGLEKKQIECIKRHLNMVFVHEIDPSFPEDQQEALDKAHTGNPGTAGSNGGTGGCGGGAGNPSPGSANGCGGGANPPPKGPRPGGRKVLC